MSSLFDMMWAPGDVRQEQDRARAQAEEMAYINAQKRAWMGGGLPSPSAAGGPIGDPTRIGRAEIPEDYARLFGQRQQQQQAPQAPQGRSSPSEIYIKALIDSGDPRAMQRGLDMRESRMIELSNAKPEKPDLITGPDGRQWFMGTGPGDHRPVVSDEYWARAQAEKAAEKAANRPQKNQQIYKVGKDERQYIRDANGNMVPLVSDEVYRANSSEPEVEWDTKLKLQRDLRKDFLAEIKPARDALNSANKSYALLDEASATGDYAGVISFLKALDPGSVVQRSESDAFKQAQGLFASLDSNLRRMKGKGSLSPAQRNQMRSAIAAITNVWKEEHNAIRTEAIRRIGTTGGYVDEANVVGPALDYDLYGGDPAGDDIAVTQQGGSNVRNVRSRKTTGGGSMADPLGIR